jgi:hypothetical protein
MKKLAVIALLLMLIIPVLPVALAEDIANVDIGIGADIVNLNVTCTTSVGGTMHIYVNGTEIKEVTVYETYQWNYDSDILYLNQKIGGVQYNLLMLANYTDGKLSMLLTNDNCLVKWIGCLDNTTLIGRRIFNGNSTVVMELNRLTNDDAVLTDTILRLAKQMDSRLAIEHNERILLAVAMGDAVEKLRIESATKRDLEATSRNLIETRNELLDIKAQFDQLRLVLMALGAVVVGLVIAWIMSKQM